VHDALDADMSFEALTPATGISVLDDCADADCTGNVHFTVDWDAIEKDDEGYVTFQYTATLNGNVATETAHTNSAWLTYSGYITTADEVEVYTYQVDVYKYTLDGSGAQVGLAGAGFVLKNSEGLYYAKDSNGDVTWVADIDDATELMTADADGDQEAVYTVVFDGLKYGTYAVVEKTVPAGYNPVANDAEAVVSENTGNRTGAIAEEGDQIEILNQTGSVLPSTGGMGTTLFYTVGGLMMAGAAVLLITKKRLANEQ
jgi:LPXTG-motif cell wall-anchored protein